MRRVIAIAVAGMQPGRLLLVLAWDSFKPTPPPVQVQLESAPPGADAMTSLGPGCKTPCSVSRARARRPASPSPSPCQIPAGDRAGAGDPQSRRLLHPGLHHVDPNPVFAELQPAGPPPKAVRKGMRPKKPKKPKAAPRRRRFAVPGPGRASPPPHRAAAGPRPAADCSGAMPPADPRTAHRLARL